ncbi:NAD(P)-binding domain-containing protein [Streptomyces sp. NBC_01622]|uniref:NAD(P)-binding domain-containing protein n=1 Tax=Streptomyces sp. NBC_01622 TaxID=2975903 RepID=UPI00386B8532|nr:NAD(P)-binding domain-containing protein [Streptomyces sp. NBC_01622]
MTDADLDYLVVGAGPAGLQVAQLLKAGGYDYAVVEESSGPGSFFAKYPRHRQMISVNKRYTGSSDPEFNLRSDWNSLLSDRSEFRFTRYTERYFPFADDMVRYLGDFAEGHGLRIRFDRRITRIARTASGFEASDSGGDTYRARRVIIATGVSRPNIPDIPGIESVELYSTVSVDPKDFIDQRVLIIGKANSALETADNLLETAAVVHVAGPSPLRLAWQSHFVGHLRAVNNNFIDTAQLKIQNAIVDARVLGIEKEAEGGYRVRFKFTRATMEHRYDRVIVCTGFRFDASVFEDGCRPMLAVNDRFPELTEAYESTNVPGLYFAGTLTQQIDFKKGTNGFIHGFRYGARALSRILEQRYHSGTWPHDELPSEPRALTDALIERVNRSSGLFQQFGVLADLLVVPDEGLVRHYQEVPVGHLHDSAFGEAENTFAVSLEYGPDHERTDPFKPGLSASVLGDGHIDAFLHPVIRHYRHGKLAETLHLPDDLENQWRRPEVHIRPLEAFFTRTIAAARAVRQ